MALAQHARGPTCSQAALVERVGLGSDTPEGVGGPSAAHLHSQARSLVCTLRVSSCVCVSWTCFFRAPVCTLRGSLCPLCVPTGFFVSFCVYTTEFCVGAHWFPPRRGGSAGPSMRVAGLCLRVPGYACVLRAALASTRVEPRRRSLTRVQVFGCVNLQLQ